MVQARMLLTRPEPQASEFAATCRQRFGDGLAITVSPVLEIVFLPLDLDPAAFDGLVFTSRNGVSAFVSASAFRDSTAWCVGDATAQAAQEAGFITRSANGALPDLATLLRAEMRGRQLLVLRGRHVAGDLADMLGSEGPGIAEAVVYDQQPSDLNSAALSLLGHPGPVLLPVFSPRSARLLGKSLLKARACLHIAVMSPAVLEALPERARRHASVASTPDAYGMMQAIAKQYEGLKSA